MQEAYQDLILTFAKIVKEETNEKSDNSQHAIDIIPQYST